MTRAVPQSAVAFIKAQEQGVFRVYDDKQPKKILQPGDKVLGVLTAGWGKTGGLAIGQEVTRAMAEIWLADDLVHKAAAPLFAKIGAVVDDLTEHQYDALLSFVFNLGTGDPKKSEWQIWRLLRSRLFDQVQAEFGKFVNWDGKKSEGLVARRAREAQLWATAEPGSQPVAPPSSVTRREPTPPTPTDPTPAGKSATIITGGLGVASTVTVAAKAVSDAIEPYKDAAPVIGQVIAVIATIAAAAAVVVLALNWLKKHRERTA